MLIEQNSKFLFYVFKAILFLSFGLQIRQLYFKQIEIKMKSYFLGFFIAVFLKLQLSLLLFKLLLFYLYFNLPKIKLADL